MSDFGKRAARSVAKQAQRADFVTLWDISRSEFPAAVAEGLIETTFREYRQRIADATAEFERQGVRVVLVAATVKELLDTLADCELPNTPNGRAAAIGQIQLMRDEQ